MGVWLIFSLSIFLTAQEGRLVCADGEIREIVQRLGYKTEGDSIKKDLDLLSNQPSKAVCHILNELRVVPEKKIKPSDELKYASAMHVIWCVRALRYITGGQDFRGKSKYKFSDSESDRKHFLTIKDKAELPFFSVWMSREIIFVAPPDAQKAIIEKWVQWYTKEGSTFQYKPSKSLDDWYF